MTPVQRHTGEDKAILERRRVRLLNARTERLRRNRTAKVTENTMVFDCQLVEERVI